jgi:hypothetical protein
VERKIFLQDRPRLHETNRIRSAEIAGSPRAASSSPRPYPAVAHGLVIPGVPTGRAMPTPAPTSFEGLRSPRSDPLLSRHRASLGIAALKEIIERDHPPPFLRSERLFRFPSCKHVEEVARGQCEAAAPIASRLWKARTSPLR